MNIVSLVEEKIERDREFAEATSNQLRSKQRHGSALTDSDIRSYFPEVYTSAGAVPSNIPDRSAFRHFILFGGPAVFDLEPLSSRQFEEKHGVSIAAAEALAEQGIIFPNLYVRTPAAWAHASEMGGLIKRSFVNGERVNAYMQLRDANFLDYVDRHKAALASAFEHSSGRLQSESLKTAGASDSGAFARILSHQWSYLNVLNSNAAEPAIELLNNGDLGRLSDYLRIAKHMVASHLTAAIGGEFVWGIESMVDFERMPEATELVCPESFEAQYWKEALNREAMEFALSAIMRISPFQIIDRPDATKLVRFLSNSENVALRDELGRAVPQLVTLARAEQITGSHVQQFQERFEDYKARLAASIEVVNIAGKIGGPVAGAGAGALVTPLMGGGVGTALALIGQMMGWLIERREHQLARALTQLGSNKWQRVFGLVEQLSDRFNR